MNLRLSITTQRRVILVCSLLVWLLFLASFLMPVIKDAYVNMVGWEAFWSCVADLWDLPDYLDRIKREPTAILISTFPSTNGAMLIAPVLLFYWPRWAGWLGFALALGGLVPLYMFSDSLGKNDLRVGYYCWVASIFLMATISLLCAKIAKGNPTGTEQQNSQTEQRPEAD